VDKLSEEDLTYIFDPLWQKDSSRTSTRNFGLGLSIVNTFVNSLGDEINVEINDNVITFSVVFR
ncbi:ATP-binding protein, partial [Paraglaciecola chathamensis]